MRPAATAAPAAADLFGQIAHAAASLAETVRKFELIADAEALDVVLLFAGQVGMLADIGARQSGGSPTFATVEDWLPGLRVTPTQRAA